MADISTPTATPVTDAVLRLIGSQLRRLELAGQLTPVFYLECLREGPRVKHCNVKLIFQDSSIILQDTK